MNCLRVAILGLGTVGTGTVNVLHRNRLEIRRRTGYEIEVVAASVNSLRKKRLCNLQDITLTTDSDALVERPDVDVVVELMGGETEAKRLVLAAINNGKHVVTANKALLALHGDEIFAAAASNRVMVLFEAAVGGGISVIKAMREGLAANRIQLVAGIINGTANYILTQMRSKGSDFASALAQSQELGYAEADPTFDVEGVDAAHKITLLASIAYGIPLAFNEVYIEGISNLERADIEYAESMGYRIKHLGIARDCGDGFEIRVHPTLIPASRLIANVDGVMNAILVQGDAVGNTLHYGAGAGAEPTASAVVADLVDILRQRSTDPKYRTPYLAFLHAMLDSSARIKKADEFVSAYYMRFTVVDAAGVMSTLTSILADAEISLEAIKQDEPVKGADTVSIIMISQKTTEAQIRSAVAAINALPAARAKAVLIRVEHFD